MALFAALSYAVTQSGRGGRSVSKEQEILIAAQVIQFAESVHQAIIRMRLIGGTSETEIDFAHTDLAGHDNVNCSTSDCLVFDPAGGGVAFQTPPANATVGGDNWYISGATEIWGIGCDGLAPCSDLILMLPNVTESICIEINERLGITSGGAAPPQDTIGVTRASPFVGSCANGSIINGDPTPFELQDQPARCFEDVAAGDYMFYFALLER